MFEDRTPEALRAEMLEAIQQSQGVTAMAGGFADGIIAPNAEQISQVYQALRAVPSMLFVDAASGGYIDLVGRQYYNITRRPGTRAACSVQLTGSAGMDVPSGTAFLTAGGLAFTLTEGVTLDESGAGTGRLEAADIGSAYNVEAGAITRMYVNLPGLTAYHNEEAAGGTDEESDAALLARIQERVRQPPTSANGYQYRQWAMAVAGVGGAKVVELAEGPGTVGLTVVDSNHRAASEEIRTAVEQYLETVRPVGCTPTVAVPREVPVTVSASVILTGDGELEHVQSAFQAALLEYLVSLIDGKYGRVYYQPEEDTAYTLLYNRVLALLLNQEGVENAEGLSVNSGVENLTLQPGEIPVPGEVELRE